MIKKIMTFNGDGVGKELMDSAKKVIDCVNETSDIKIEYYDYPFGASAIDEYGTPFPQITKDNLGKVDAILLSSIGDPNYSDVKYTAEMALLDLRKELDVYLNIRPFKVYDELINLTSFKPEVIKDVDFVIFRELSSGAYFAKPRNLKKDEAIDTIYYSYDEIYRIVKKAFEFASKSKRKLTSIDKANVLATSKLWRSVVEEVAKEYPDVDYNHQLVDSAALKLVTNPKEFQLIVTENLFGDILSDQCASLLGSLGMMASASLGTKIGLFEPGHGSAPDIAGMDIVNPIAMLKSVAMMYQYSFDDQQSAAIIESAIRQTLKDKIMSKDLDKDNYVGTIEFTDAIIERMKRNGMRI